MQHVDDRAAEIVHRRRREIEQVSRDVHARARRHRLRDAAHHGVQVLHRQRVLDRRLRIGCERAREPQVRVQMVVRQHRVVLQRIGPPVRQQIGDDVHHPAHLVGDHVDDARPHRATARGCERRALTTSG